MINKEEFIQLLKDNLTIELDDASGTYTNQWIEATILFGGEVISSDVLEVISND